MGQPIISVSGLRGIVGDSLTPEVALRYGVAFAATLPAGPMLLTRDGRTTGRMLAAALTAGLEAVGRDVIDGGIAATPTTGVMVQSLGAAGGIQISASHNPPDYNGLKLISAAGRVIPAAEGEAVIARYRQGTIAWQPHDRLGSASRAADAGAEHLRRVLDAVDAPRIRARQFRVLLDACHGAGSVLGRLLLEQLGCHLTVLGGTPDGAFEHPPEPTAENLAEVRAQVVAAGADVGFCQDPDADRLAVIDAGGRYVGEEYTLAVCVAQRLRQARGPVVTNCATSRMCEDLARDFGVPFVRSAVGEANVVDAMLRCGALVGGEGNGGLIDPRVVLVRDSLLAMAVILDAMAARSLTFAQLVDELPRYAIVKSKVELPAQRATAAIERLITSITDAKVDRQDGVRFDWPDRWLLVRPSNTEPIIRAIAEAPTDTEARALCDRAAAALGS